MELFFSVVAGLVIFGAAAVAVVRQFAGAESEEGTPAVVAIRSRDRLSRHRPAA